MEDFRPLLIGLFVAALLALSCQAATVNRPAEEYEATVSTSSGDSYDPLLVGKAEETAVDADADEATVEDAAAAITSDAKPFFYAAKANVDAAGGGYPTTTTTEGEGPDSTQPEVAGDDDDEPSEDDLHQMMESVVGEIMMADELEAGLGRSAQSAVWKDPYLPEYMQGMLGQLGGFSMALQSPYPNFDFPLSSAHLYDHHQPLYSPFAKPPSYNHQPLVSAPEHCPPCHCSYDDDHDEDEYDDEDDYELLAFDEDEDEDHYGYQEDDDVTVPYGFVFNPTIRYNGRSRSKRSVGSEDDYWNSIGDASKHLSKYNVGYRIKNDLRQRLEDDSYYPLHFGHIYTGGLRSHKLHDRAFGYDADFDLYTDSGAFKHTPHGPRLGKRWMKSGFPIYAYSLYKLRATIKARQITKNGPIAAAPIKPGVYRMVFITSSTTKGLMFTFEDVKTRVLYIVEPTNLSKFQALLPFKDPNARYFSLKSATLGDTKIFSIKATPLTGASPKVKTHLFQHGFDKFKHLTFNKKGLFSEHNKVGKKTQP